MKAILHSPIPRHARAAACFAARADGAGAGVLVLLFLLVVRLPAADLPWHSLTGGGGVSQHGAVALGGAFGPIAPALSPATGGPYTLAGGFWSALDGLPRAAAPVLRIQSIDKGAQAVLSWPVGLHGFVLEYTPQLGSGIWMMEGTPVVDTLTEHTVTVPAGTGSRAYRLRSQ